MKFVYVIYRDVANIDINMSAEVKVNSGFAGNGELSVTVTAHQKTTILSELLLLLMQ